MKLFYGILAAAVLLAATGCTVTSNDTKDTSSRAVSSDWYLINTPDGTSSVSENEKKLVESASPSPIAAAWAGESDVSEYDELVVEKTDYNSDIILTAKENLTQLRVTSVSIILDDKSENTSYGVEDKCFYGDLNDGKSLKLSLPFPGDIPTNGIAFKDASGKEYFYALQQSGKDGSLILLEIA